MTLASASSRGARLSDRVGRRLRALGARTRHRLGLGFPNPGEVRIAGAFRHPVDATRRAPLLEQYRQRFPLAAEREMDEAQRLAAHRFHLLGHAMEHGETIRWSLDPVSGRDWPRSFSPDITYRGPERLGDIKLPWELNKHQYFFTLGKCAWLSGDRSYAGEIVRQIDGWIGDNPYLTGINWISALEAGTRAVSWIMAYPFYADGCGDAFRERLAASLAQHVRFVHQNLSTGPFANTHLVGEAVTLVAGGLFLETRQSGAWLARGLQILEEEISRQVTPDGLHAERSIAYHRFFLDNYYLTAALLEANGRAFTRATCGRMEAMTDALMHLLLPDGSVPAFGDADDARAIWVRADAPWDYRGLLALGAVRFGRQDFKVVAGGITEEVLWLLGPQAVHAFDRLEVRAPAEASAAYPRAGYYIMRQGWGASEPVLAFDCGPLGFGPAGHGHADALSFQLHAGGAPVLVDSGTFSYNLDYEWRDAFRSTRAHNTVVVDRENQSVPADRMSWKSAARAEPHRWVTTPWFDLADGSHDGYCRLPDPVTHRRSVFFLKPDVWVVWDDLRARRRHQLELMMHVHPDCAIQVEPGAPGFLLTSPAGARIRGRLEGEGHLDAVSGSDAERTVWFSPAYGQRVPSHALRVTSVLEGVRSLVTCLTASDEVSATAVAEPGWLDVRVHRPHEIEDHLSYRTGDRLRAVASPFSFDGELLFRRSVAGTPTLIEARGFRELALEGLLEVRAPGTIDRLTLAHDRCDIVLDQAHAPGLRLRVTDRLQLMVNGRPWPGGETEVDDAMGRS